MRKLELKDKVQIAWFKKTGKDDGWEVFQAKVANPRISQEDIGRDFGVTLSTSQRWHKEYNAQVA
jgi:hypothetical protein